MCYRNSETNAFTIVNREKAIKCDGRMFVQYILDDV